MVSDRPTTDGKEPTDHGIVYTLTSFGLSFVCGLVLPIGLMFLFVGIPYVIGIGISGMVHILDLPGPIGMTVWYTTVGAIGGIASGTWKWGYASGLFAIVLLLPGMIIWPWVLASVLSWVVFDLTMRWMDRDETRD